MRNAERYKTLRQYWQASLEAMMKSLFMAGGSALVLAGAVYLGIIRAERIHLGFALPAKEELDIYQHVHKSGILVASLWLSSIASAGPGASISGPADKQGALAHRQLWRVPSTDPDVLMFTTVFSALPERTPSVRRDEPGNDAESGPTAIFSLAGI